MVKTIEIEIIIDDFCVSSLHQTISSILAQRNLSNFSLQVTIQNPHNIQIEPEVHRLKKAAIPITKSKTKSNYYFKLHNSDIISHSFLYKAIHYLENNNVAFVSPEYTFQKIKNTPLVASIANYNIPLNNTLPSLIDCNKLYQNNQIPQSSAIIKDTCFFSISQTSSLKKSIRNYKHSSHFFDSPLFLPSRFVHQPENTIKQKNSHSYLSNILSYIKRYLPKKTRYFFQNIT